MSKAFAPNRSDPRTDQRRGKRIKLRDDVSTRWVWVDISSSETPFGSSMRDREKEHIRRESGL